MKKISNYVISYSSKEDGLVFKFKEKAFSTDEAIKKFNNFIRYVNFENKEYSIISVREDK